MPRSVNLPPFRSWCPDRNEPVLPLDREPLRTRLSFTNNMKEDHPMSKEEFVIHCIRHSEDYPETGEIDMNTARSVLDNLVPDDSLPTMTTEEFRSMWNSFVHDPEVMAID